MALLELRMATGTRQCETSDFPLTIGGSGCDIEIPLRPTAGPVAHLGLAEGDLFLQPTARSEAVYCNGGLLTTSQWLRSGDKIRVGGTSLLFTSDAGRAFLQVQEIGRDDTTEPPSVMAAAPPPLHDETGAGNLKIRPVEFKPNPLESHSSRRRAPRPLALALWSLLALLTLAAWYIFSAKPVEVRVEPAPESLRLEGGLLRPMVAGSFFLRPGSYTVYAESPGYRALEASIEVTKASRQVFDFELDLLPGYLNIDLGIETAATIWVDGREKGVWPLEAIELTAGEHRVQVRAQGYREIEEAVAIEGGGKQQTLEIKMQPLWAVVTFSSEPLAATVRVDGEVLGQTPLTTEVLEGERSLEISLAGFKPHRSPLRLQAEETLELPTVRLQPNDGKLLLSSRPEGATVTVDGEYRGKTPLEVIVVPDRRYRVSISKLGFETSESEVSASSGVLRKEHIDLVERVGEIEIVTKNEGAELLVNDQPRGPANQTLRLQAIEQKIEIRKTGYISHVQTLTPRPGVPQALEITLLTQEEAKAATILPVVKGPQGQELRLIDPGRFRMGAPRREPGRRANEALRQVELTRAFYMATREVSNKEFREFKEKHRSGKGGRKSLEADHHAVVNVSWEDAARYCNWLSGKESLPPAYEFRGGRLEGVRPMSLGYRLPTEAEWAWAARFAAGRHLKYPWGSALPITPNSGNYADLSAQGNLEETLPNYSDGFPATSPTDSFKPNAVGLQNLGGNVAEWIHDYYAVAASHSGPPIANPTGPENGDYHVIRGSSWMHSTVTELRLSYRDYGNKPRSDLGFRIVRFVE